MSQQDPIVIVSIARTPMGGMQGVLSSFSANQLERAQQRYQRWGQWSLLLSWMPVIGDPLTLIAGIMREPFWRFVLLVTLAKGGRYLVLAMITLGWLHGR